MPPAVPPLIRVSDVKKQQEFKYQGFNQPNIYTKDPQITNPPTVQSSTPTSQTVVVQSAPQNVLNQQRDESLSKIQYYARN